MRRVAMVDAAELPELEPIGSASIIAAMIVARLPDVLALPKQEKELLRS